MSFKKKTHFFFNKSSKGISQAKKATFCKLHLLDCRNSRRHLKTLWVKDKIQNNSFFSFSNHVFSPLEDKSYPLIERFPKQSLAFTCLQYKSLENTEKRRNCLQKAISPFPTVSTRLENFMPFSSNLKLSSAISVSLEGFKICCLGRA